MSTANLNNAVQAIHLLDTLGIPGLFCHRDGLIQLVNDSLAVLVISEPHHLQGMNLAELTAFVDMLDLIEAGQPVTDPVVRRVGELYCLVRMQIVGEVGYLFSFQDVTDYHEREKNQHDATQMVAHDLKTPISVIKSYADLVRQMGDLSPQQEKFLNRIQLACQNMRHLVSDLLDLAWIDANSPLEHEQIRLDYLLKAVEENLQELIRDAGLSLELTLVDDLPPLQADADRLRRVFNNLITNAIKFSPDGAEIQVETRQEDGYVAVDVHDSGPGIPSEYLPYIFERFYQVPRPEGDDQELSGSGLGLAIVRAIVEKHGGDVRVQSTVGQGTTFTVRLPLA